MKIKTSNTIVNNNMHCNDCDELEKKNDYKQVLRKIAGVSHKNNNS